MVLGDENITLTIGKLNCSVSQLWSETDSTSHNWSCFIFQIVSADACWTRVYCIIYSIYTSTFMLLQCDRRALEQHVLAQCSFSD